MNTKKECQSRMEEQILDEFEKEILELGKQGSLSQFETAMDHAVEKFTAALKERTDTALDKATPKDGKKKTCVECGGTARIVNYDGKLEIKTKYGKLSLKRDYYFCRNCHEGFTALESELKLLDNHKVTLEMAALITYAGQVAMSFEKASELIQTLRNIEISPSTIRTITEETGKKVHKKDMERAKNAYENPEIASPYLGETEKKKGVLYLMMDGSAVNTSQVNNGSSWKEMKLGLVFTDHNRIKRNDGKMIITEKEYVTYFGEVGEFKKLLFDAAARAGYGTIEEVVVIGDGARWIWNMCEELFPEAVQILDYFHLSENVHGLSRYLHPKNDIEMKKWAKSTLKEIEEGRIDEVIQQLPELTGKKLPKDVPNLKVYLGNNRCRIDYKQYKQQEYYIGSGAIESGNKLVIQQRMKQSGMRWSLSGGQYVASLRAKYASNQWEEVKSVIGI